MNTRAFVRIPCRSRADAKELALRLQADDRRAVRRWQAVIVSTETPAEAERLALSLQSWVAEAGTHGVRHGSPDAVAALESSV